MMIIVLRLLSLLGLKSRWHRHFSPRPLNEVFFQGWGVGGLVDSWPETLVPSASNRSTPEWTLVDSRRCDSMKSNFALIHLAHETLARHLGPLVAGIVLALRDLDLDRLHVVIRDLVEQVADAVQPRALLLVGIDHEPRG